MPFVIVQTELPTIYSQQTVTLNWLINLFANPSTGTFRRFRARLFVDDVEVPIKSYSFDDPRDFTNVTLNVGLVRKSDYDLFTRDADIRFEIGEKISGVWSDNVMLDTGQLTSADYQFQNDGLAPADTFSITAKPLIAARLDETSLDYIVLVDPNKLTVDPDDLEAIPNIDGTNNEVTVTEIEDFSLYDLLDYVATACGFAGSPPYLTNIPNFPLRRVDFQPGNPLWNEVAAYIGDFEPILDISPDDQLIVLEGLSDYQPDTSAALVLTVDDLAPGTNVNSTFNRSKGIIITYQEDGKDYDYTQFDIVHNDRYRNDVPGSEPLTSQETWVEKFYLSARPNKPVRELRRKEMKRVSVGPETLAQSAETLNYNEYGLLRTREKRIFGKSKVPASWATFSSGVTTLGVFDGGETSYSSASDSSFPWALSLQRAEREENQYKAHPFKADEVYTAHHEVEARSLITIDSENQQLEEDFEQPALRAYRSGNMATGQGSRYGTSDFRWEKMTPQRNGTVLIATSAEDNLNIENAGEALLPEDYEDTRVGDIGISVIKAIQRTAFIDEGADATAKRISTLNLGPIPLNIGEPLAVRYNRRQFYPRTINARLPYPHFGIVKGRAVDPQIDGRSTSLGVFRIIGRTFTGEIADGVASHSCSFTANQISAPTVTAEPMGLNDSFNVSLGPSGTKTFTFNVVCLPGQQITGHAVSDVAIELKRTADVSWTNIETTPYDVDPYAGTTVEFQLKITASAFTDPHIVHTFTLIIGPD